MIRQPCKVIDTIKPIEKYCLVLGLKNKSYKITNSSYELQNTSYKIKHNSYKTKILPKQSQTKT